MRTRVKICGITRLEDALAAVNAGADALGMVFYEPSPRNIDISKAAEIAKKIPGFVSLVGLVVNAGKERVQQILSEVPLQVVQFHGDEMPDECDAIDHHYIKAMRLGTEGSGLSGESLRKEINSFESAAGVLLDTYRKGTPGGTGEKFDWDLVPQSDEIQGKPIILAGGLTPENVFEAVKTVKPYAVDVSGGVESEPGIKDAARIRAFLESVRDADRQLSS